MTTTEQDDDQKDSEVQELLAAFAKMKQPHLADKTNEELSTMLRAAVNARDLNAEMALKGELLSRLK